MLESSNKFNHNYHLSTAIHTEAPAISGGTPPTPEDPKNPNKKRNRNIILGAVGVVAAGALAATLAVGLGSGNGNKSHGEQPPKSTETSAPAYANEKGNNVTPEYTFSPDLINIPAGLSDQEYATRVIDDFSKWDMAGATDANYNKWSDGGFDNSLETSIAADNLNTVQDSHLFSEVGLADSTIKVAMKNQALANEGYLQAWFTTYNQPGQKPAAGQREAFNNLLSMDSFTATKTANGGRDIIIEGTQHNNSDKNTYSTQQHLVEQNGLKFEFHITTSVANGFEQIDTLNAK